MRSGKKSQLSAAPPSRDGDARFCDQPDCLDAGLYRAPRSRENLRQYYWFCLPHVREYNQAWNFYAGLTQLEVETLNRHDTVWQRPSWPFGDCQARRFHTPYKMRDAFHFFNEDAAARPGAGPASPETEETKAFHILELTPPATVEKIKERYKALVKRHHPDMHGGDKAGEDRLKEINLAYQTLINTHCS